MELIGPDHDWFTIAFNIVFHDGVYISHLHLRNNGYSLHQLKLKL